MHPMYDPVRVVISIIIAVFFAFVSFEAVDSIQRGPGRFAWTCSGGLTLGMGIWSMHFIGMNAYTVSVPILYSVKLTILSAVPAIAASCFALHLASALLRPRVLTYASVLMGSGITTMHYVGMAAANFQPRPTWKPGMVLLSFLVSIVASAIALKSYSFCFGRKQLTVKRQLAAALVIAGGICGMHYVGMAAMCLPHHLVATSEGAGYVTGNVLAQIGIWTALVMLFSVLIVSRDQKQRWVEALNAERLAALEAARKSEKLILAGKLSASIAHEINNPLGALMNLVYLAQHEPASTPQQAEYLEGVQSELQRVSQITTHALKFYRQSAKPAPVSLNALVESVLALFAGRITEIGALIEVRSREIPQVICCEGEIRQVLTNLVVNALDALAGQPGGRLLVTTKVLGEQVVISIADTGGGITAAARAKVFEPFFTTKEDRGTGLGLWVSKEIVDRHSGSLALRSSTSGTVFQLRLPTNPQQERPIERTAASPKLDLTVGVLA